MLSASHRLTSPTLFREVVRRGRRAGGPSLVLHLLVRGTDLPLDGPRVGLVVSKAVGPAVTRNLVKRRLRHLTRERLSSLPGSGMLVIRALPAAADLDYQQLGAELDRLLGKFQAQPVAS